MARKTANSHEVTSSFSISSSNTKRDRLIAERDYNFQRPWAHYNLAPDTRYIQEHMGISITYRATTSFVNDSDSGSLVFEKFLLSIDRF